MAESSTVNLGWTKPDPGASANTWGTTLNGTTDKIDAAVFALQQGAMPIGSIVMWAGVTPPTNWLLCNGQALVITAYQALYNVCQTSFNVAGVAAGSFNVPSLVQKFPIGAGPNPLGTTGGAFSVTLGTGNIPAHTHSISDPSHYHTINDAAHNHSVNQWTHNHGDSGHGHADAGSYQDPHAHGIPYDVVNPAGGGLTSGGPSFGLVGGVGTDNRTPPLHIGVSTGYANIDARTSVISLNNSNSNISSTTYASTGISNNTGSTGSGAAFNVVPPFQAVNYIIRYQ